MNVLSLFDGVSCGRVALDRAGIRVDKYYVSEVDKFAIQVAKYNYPDTVHLGDVTKWREWGIDWSQIDMVIGGSPCTGFSAAGKGLNFEDPQSKLFFEYVDIVNHVKSLNPNMKFLLENVKMKKQWLDVITGYMGVEPTFINSSLLSAQSRQRWYWTNINDGKIEQPEDVGILLKDIIETGVDIDAEKARTIDANYAKGGKIGGIHQSSKRNYLVTGGAMRGRYGGDGKTSQKLEVRDDNKSNSMTTVQKDSLLIQVGTADMKGHDILKRVYSIDGKSPSLMAAKGGNQEPKIAIREATKKGYVLAGVGDFVDLSFPNSKTRRGRVTVGKSNTITAGLGEAGVILEDLTWRKLTPLECERLQTLEDNYTANGINEKGDLVKVSNSQRYRQCGNGWTVNVIAHIFNHMNKNDNQA